MSIGSRIKERRVQLHITQNELANIVGVTKAAIGNYESNVSKPRESILVKLCVALDIDPNYLYQDSFQKEKSPLPDESKELNEKLQGLIEQLSTNQIKELIHYVYYLIYSEE